MDTSMVFPEDNIQQNPVVQIIIDEVLKRLRTRQNSNVEHTTFDVLTKLVEDKATNPELLLSAHELIAWLQERTREEVLTPSEEKAEIPNVSSDSILYRVYPPGFRK